MRLLIILHPLLLSPLSRSSAAHLSIHTRAGAAPSPSQNHTAHFTKSYCTLSNSYCTLCVPKHTILGHGCICGQGRTDYVSEVIRLRIPIWEFFEGFLNIARWSIFHNFPHISGKTDRIFVEISSQMHLCTRKSTFGSHPNPDSGYGLRIRT